MGTVTPGPPKHPRTHQAHSPKPQRRRRPRDRPSCSEGDGFSGSQIRRTRAPAVRLAGKTQPSKYSTSSSGLQVKSYQVLDAKMDELTRVVDLLKNEFKELELVLEKKDAVARRRPLKMLVGVTVGFTLGFYTNKYVSA